MASAVFRKVGARPLGYPLRVKVELNVVPSITDGMNDVAEGFEPDDARRERFDEVGRAQSVMIEAVDLIAESILAPSRVAVDVSLDVCRYRCGWRGRLPPELGVDRQEDVKHE